MKNEIIEYYEKISKKNHIKYVFFDCFETVIHRMKHTENLKMIWARKLKSSLHLNISASNLYKIRKEAEQVVSLKKGIILQEYTYADLIKQIFIRLKSFEKIEVNYMEVYKKAFDTEISIEKENCYIDCKTLEAIEFFKKNGIRCAVLSDFYFSSVELSLLLENIGLNSLDRVCVSADYEKSKYTGELYTVVCRELKVAESEAMMVGDNRISDYLNAKKQGLFAYYKRWDKYPAEINSKYIIKKMKEISGTNRRHPYANYAFSLFYFIEELYEKLNSTERKSVLFLAREGEMLKSLFDLYCVEHNNFEIESIYFYTSRIASFAAGLKDIMQETFDSLFDKYRNMSVKIFLESLGFKKEWIESIEHTFPYDINLNISNFRVSEEFLILKKNETFIKFYDFHRSTQRKYLYKYLEQLGVNYQEGITIVDVGWRGTIQDNLFRFFDENINIMGYYIGISKIWSMSEENKKEGILFTEYPMKSQNFEIWNFDKFMFERILLASHPTTVRYKVENDKIVPELIGYMQEEKAFNYIMPYQKEVKDIFKDLNQQLMETCYRAKDFEDVFTHIHLKMLCKVGKREIAMQKKLYEYNYESFGEFGQMKSSFTSELTDAIRKRRIPVKKIFRSGISFSYIHSVSLTIMCITHGMGWFLPFLYRILYTAEKRKIDTGM